MPGHEDSPGPDRDSRANLAEHRASRGRLAAADAIAAIANVSGDIKSSDRGNDRPLAGRRLSSSRGKRAGGRRSAGKANGRNEKKRRRRWEASIKKGPLAAIIILRYGGEIRALLISIIFISGGSRGLPGGATRAA
jgi:hypothetical protein